SLAGAALWGENGDRQQAATTMRLHVDADQVRAVLLFVAAPARGPEHADIAFTVRALDTEGGSATHATRFDRPETEEDDE
ncbi:MAG: cytochrome c oxidase accessory protein CcoG, partial [Sphingomonas sp.]|nr:cytochrome c oxidase accessory protein CcoG [Sphingomonas sp.]